VTPFGCRERVQTATGWLDRQTTSSLVLVEQRFFEAPPIQGIHLAGRVASAQSAHGFAKKLDAAARKGTCARAMPALYRRSGGLLFLTTSKPTFARRRPDGQDGYTRGSEKKSMIAGSTCSGASKVGLCPILLSRISFAFGSSRFI
jgi:hypothetical protein